MEKIKREMFQHYILSFIGGNFAIYSLLEHSNVFGSAETSNMILLVENILQVDFFHIIIRVGSLLVYAGGIAFSVWLTKRRKDLKKRICLMVDGIAALLLWLIPPETNPITALYPASFAMSVQWCIFKGVCDNPSATTFSTGNFRQLVTNIFNYIEKRDASDLFRIKFYLLTMLSFHTGVAFIYIIWQYIPHQSILFVLIPIAIAFFGEIKRSTQKNMTTDLLSQVSGCEDI